ncbi:hypothetical protein ACIQCG_01080 [Streptomyces noursei]|uniref:hypothetical protein n=1 Tax=Streptomyces noursei TaxID=1971 RepID=UPI003827A302
METKMVPVKVPAVAEGAEQPWRLWLQALDEAVSGRAQCEGHWLQAGGLYELPVGALIVATDRPTSPDRDTARVRLWRVGRGGRLITERDSLLPRDKKFGTSVVNTLRRRLEKYPAQRTYEMPRAPRPPEPKRFVVEVPAVDPGAVRAWRKLLTGLDEASDKGMAVCGTWLEAGASYKVTPGTLIVACDPFPGDGKKRVRILRVARGGEIRVERDSTLGWRNAFSTSVRQTLRRLLEKYPPPGGTIEQVSAAPPQANDFEGRCELCGQPVAARTGILVRRHNGSRVTQHHPGKCPPPPVHQNQWAGSCGICNGWLEAGEGVLYQAGSVLLPATKIRHEQECPPAAERKPVPPRVNERDEACDACGHMVAAGEGTLTYECGWVVRHRKDQCPRVEKETLWQIDRGVPGRFRPRPEQWKAAGTVLRAEVFDRGEPFPEDAPGYRRLRDYQVSAIVTTVRELPPIYCRDEDGNNPGCLIGENGWYFRILVRPATAEEAADILAREEKEARRRKLENRRRDLCGLRADDGDVPEHPFLDGAQQINFGAKDRRSLLQHWPDDGLLVDEARGVLWTLRYNGADGDDWSLNNYASFIASRFPLTDERRTLIADLRAEYDQEESAPADTEGDGQHDG